MKGRLIDTAHKILTHWLFIVTGGITVAVLVLLILG